jgi:hypothetical protein
MQEKRVCRIHGGLSRGPVTETGRRRCAEAKTVHGGETRAFRTERQQTFAELRELEKQLKARGLIAGGRSKRG